MDPPERSYFPIPTPDVSPVPWSSYGEDAFLDPENDPVQEDLTLQTSHASSETTLANDSRKGKEKDLGTGRKGKNLTRREHKKSRAGCFSCKSRKIKVSNLSRRRKARKT
jgi:hypothetical protein